MTKLTLDNIDDRLRQLELNIEKIILIQDNIQNNYLNLYDDIKAIRNDMKLLKVDIKNLEIKESTIEANINWITKLKNYSLISGGLVTFLYLLYEFLKRNN